MKEIKNVKQGKVFQPVAISFVIETLEELEKLRDALSDASGLYDLWDMVDDLVIDAKED